MACNQQHQLSQGAVALQCANQHNKLLMCLLLMSGLWFMTVQSTVAGKGLRPDRTGLKRCSTTMTEHLCIFSNALSAHVHVLNMHVCVLDCTSLSCSISSSILTLYFHSFAQHHKGIWPDMCPAGFQMISRLLPMFMTRWVTTLAHLHNLAY